MTLLEKGFQNPEAAKILFWVMTVIAVMLTIIVIAQKIKNKNLREDNKTLIDRIESREPYTIGETIDYDDGSQDVIVSFGQQLTSMRGERKIFLQILPRFFENPDDLDIFYDSSEPFGISIPIVEKKFCRSKNSEGGTWQITVEDLNGDRYTLN